jgi:hypothetical protein
MALAYMGLRPSGRSGGHLPGGSDDPAWLDRESPPPTVHVLSEDEPAAPRPEACPPPMLLPSPRLECYVDAAPHRACPV